MHAAIQSLPEAQRAALEAAYATPPRPYHNFQHVLEVLRHVDTVAEGPGWQQPREVQLAALYHDAIYVAGRSDNEAQSAQLAREQIARWQPDAAIDVARVMQLIDLTARHGGLSPEQVDAEAALFLDCDMAILAAPPEVFDAYDRGIAQEYRAVVPGWIFRRKRRQFLRGLLARERIYLSDFFHERLDLAARENLRRVTRNRWWPF
ncbi:Predicted metal-dependent phosphohydrolase, HD superfamily [Pseudoxanthomonas sp. GM95]|uniref:HD domain-containing protein n=1 Tax=Pseudoxanthomonas sp. GM95 TaxID=1881043 RepID=UPI0008C692DB|nr:HD domain-containing protein [Pseudoxanthomonas sp. GM95]SEK77718.1 Predicted metal-dependent phosphohydrolase, HD superfamily [Pseudoxanthomonas sp. GM95]